MLNITSDSLPFSYTAIYCETLDDQSNRLVDRIYHVILIFIFCRYCFQRNISVEYVQGNHDRSFPALDLAHTNHYADQDLDFEPLNYLRDCTR